jgi:hypothetical protein
MLHGLCHSAVAARIRPLVIGSCRPTADIRLGYSGTIDATKKRVEDESLLPLTERGNTLSYNPFGSGRIPNITSNRQNAGII